MSAKQKKNIIAMIPARIGSQRLPMKNLALLNGRPLISYAIEAAKSANIFTKIIVNSENEIFAKIAKRYKVDFYKRSIQLATSEAKSDFVVYDFLKNNPCDYIAWINPTSPLQQGAEIIRVVKYFQKEKLDTLITVKNEQVHCVYRNKPLNFKLSEEFAKTQDLSPVQSFVYSVMMWRADTFIKDFEKNKHAFFCGRIGFYPISSLASIIIKKKEDLMLAEYIISAFGKKNAYKVRYDKFVDKLEE